jgi:hypothetical protein
MKIHYVALAGAAALAFIGSAFAASSAPKPQIHEITVALPGGGEEHIRYVGTIAPEVVVTNPFAPTVAVADPFVMDPILARLARVHTQMNAFWANFNRQMSRQAAGDPAFAAMNDPNFPINVSMGRLPKGMTGYSFVSTFSSNGACSRMVRITSDGADARPQVVSQTSGDCKGVGTNGVTATHDNGTADTLKARYIAPRSDAPRQSL